MRPPGEFGTMKRHGRRLIPGGRPPARRTRTPPPSGGRPSGPWGVHAMSKPRAARRNKPHTPVADDCNRPDPAAIRAQAEQLLQTGREYEQDLVIIPGDLPHEKLVLLCRFCREAGDLWCALADVGHGPKTYEEGVVVGPATEMEFHRRLSLLLAAMRRDSRLDLTFAERDNSTQGHADSQGRPCQVFDVEDGAPRLEKYLSGLAGLLKGGAEVDGGPAALAEPPLREEGAPPAAFVFRPDGGKFEVRFQGTEHGYFNPDKGFGYIRRLLDVPYRTVKAIALTDRKEGGEGLTVSEDEAAVTFREDPEDALQEELFRLSEQIKAADRDEEHEQAAVLRERFNKACQEVQKFTTGPARPRNRRRKLTGPVARAFESVRKALTRAFDTLENATPPLPECARHLRDHIKPDYQGGFRYIPTQPPDWKL